MEWEYTSHPNYPFPLIVRTEEVLESIQNATKEDIVRLLIDTRGVHKHLFSELTSNGHEYFAGHYRGEDFGELKHYQIQRLSGALQDCCPALEVPSTMEKFGEKVGQGIEKLDALITNQPSDIVMNRVIKFACDVCVEFCKIHPYANGNGHISRMILISILQTYGYEIRDFPIDPRPPEKNYINYMMSYAAGDRTPLLLWISNLIES